jgi:hypothetical protein
MHVNATHFQVTAKCSGCTTWSVDGTPTTLDPDSSHELAWSHSSTPPTNPADANSTFQQHDAVGMWNAEFAQAESYTFEALVAKNLGPAKANASLPAPFRSATNHPEATGMTAISWISNTSSSASTIQSHTTFTISKVGPPVTSNQCPERRSTTITRSSSPTVHHPLTTRTRSSITCRMYTTVLVQA